eukprot:9124057-Prorocentrum_lima.AAC.1
MGSDHVKDRALPHRREHGERSIGALGRGVSEQLLCEAGFLHAGRSFCRHGARGRAVRPGAVRG